MFTFKHKDPSTVKSFHESSECKEGWLIGQFSSICIVEHPVLLQSQNSELRHIWVDDILFVSRKTRWTRCWRFHFQPKLASKSSLLDSLHKNKREKQSRNKKRNSNNNNHLPFSCFVRTIGTENTLTFLTYLKPQVPCHRSWGSHFLSRLLDIILSNEITDSFYLVLQDCVSPSTVQLSFFFFKNYLPSSLFKTTYQHFEDMGFTLCAIHYRVWLCQQMSGRLLQNCTHMLDSASQTSL